MAQEIFGREDHVADILVAAAQLLAARSRGTNHSDVDSERRRAVDDAINLYDELMQRLRGLPHPPITRESLRDPAG